MRGYMRKSYSLVLFLIYQIFALSSQAYAYTPNQYLPTGLDKNTPDEIKSLGKDLFSGIEDKQIAAMQGLKNKSNDPDLAPHAYFLLSRFYETEKNFDMARAYLSKCLEADPEFSPCHLWLGLYALHGAGGEEDHKLAFKSFRASAEQDSAAGEWHLAMAYLKGQGVMKDKDQAFEYVKRSASKDYIAGLYSYGVMKAKGEGTRKNEKEAFQAYARAAHLGDYRALYSVGIYYNKGRGVEKNLDLADTAILAASFEGHPEALQLVRKALDEMDDEASQRWFSENRERKTFLMSELKRLGGPIPADD